VEGRSHDDFPGVEIIITRGVGEMVRDLTIVTASTPYINSSHQQP